MRVSAARQLSAADDLRIVASGTRSGRASSRGQKVTGAHGRVPAAGSMLTRGLLHGAVVENARGDILALLIRSAKGNCGRNLAK
jgi:hypothetical protein